MFSLKNSLMRWALLLFVAALALPSCQKEKTPTTMTITGVRITQFPSTDAGGASWDLGSGADLYVQITNSSGTVLFDSDYFEDAVSGGTGSGYLYTPTSPVNITCPTCQYTLSLYDYDELDADDFIGSYSFRPYTAGDNEENSSSQAVLYSASGAAFAVNFTYSY